MTIRLGLLQPRSRSDPCNQLRPSQNDEAALHVALHQRQFHFRPKPTPLPPTKSRTRVEVRLRATGPSSRPGRRHFDVEKCELWISDGFAKSSAPVRFPNTLIGVDVRSRAPNARERLRQQLRSQDTMFALFSVGLIIST